MSDINIKTTLDISNLLEELSYDGYDPIKLRSKFNNSDESIKDIIICLSAYSKVGNNSNKLTNKVKDKNTGKKVLNTLKKLDVKNSAESSDSLTLPRIASAFMPVYFLFRILLNKNLGANDHTNTEIADICFCGYKEIYNYKGYKEFYDEFSRSISNLDHELRSARETKKQSLAEIRADIIKEHNDNQIRWLKIIRTGFINDSKVMKLMEGLFTLYKKNELRPNLDDLKVLIEHMITDREFDLVEGHLVFKETSIINETVVVNIEEQERVEVQAEKDDEARSVESGQIEENEEQLDNDNSVKTINQEVMTEGNEERTPKRQREALTDDQQMSIALHQSMRKTTRSSRNKNQRND